ncbi:7-carboxy-7-deazaguanine synthase [Candidatus Magnetobacterium bavaricum]|uniref:7-carboxy-7-deazaguanine synthase n=1 Tax=Candidatus Magnetobacterium bavaricum TaxID=29290 RepID=A0A0F3GJQ7_9BACT|nr:7-carboxy-7-deazaguanine synthase [Candidatus Magnetobacterium bavaricum]
MQETLRVCEFFTSIQGESSYAGLPCVFVRLTGCNLRCSYCDTRYAYTEGTDVPVAQLLRDVQATNLRLVEITGGEPLLQDATPILIDGLIGMGLKTLIETNGSVNISRFNRGAIFIVDLKAPSSGMSDHNDLSNLKALSPTDEVKMVIANRDDYQWASDLIARHRLTQRCHVLLSSVAGELQPETLAAWILHDALDVRLNLQLHKYIYGADRRMV